MLVAHCPRQKEQLKWSGFCEWNRFHYCQIGAGLSFTGNTLTNTINNTNQLTNGAGFLTNITSLISAGTNVTITGSGTSGSPYVINSSGGGGGGTVTNFSAGTLSPLFTTSVSNPTTIPGLSFTLSNATANSVFGNNTGSSAPPVYYVPTITTLNGWASGSIALLGATQTFTGLNTFNGGIVLASNITFSANNTYSIGNVSDVAAHVWSRVFESDAGVALQAAAGNVASIDINTVPGITLLSTGQAQLNNYVANNSFTGSGIAFIENDESGNLVQIPIGNIATQTALNDTAAALRATTSLFYPVQLLSPIGNSADSFALGGVAGPAFQNDSLYFANNKLFIYNLNASFSTLVAGDSVMVHGSGGQVKYLPSSAIGGGGSVSSVSDNGGGTLTISPTTGSVLAGINLANSNTWTATNTTFKNILPSATTTYSLGSTGAYWNNVYTNNLDVNNILPPSNLLIQLATGQSMQTAINGVTKEELLSTGQKQFNGYGSGTFTGTATYTLNVDATGHLIEGAVGGGGITQLFGKSPIAVSGTDTAYMDTTMLINAQYPYGYEYNKNYFADTLDFRTTFNSTMSVDTSMHLEIGNNGSTDSTGNVIKMVNATLLEKFVMTAQVIVTTPGKGFGIGLYGQNAAEPISLLGFVPTAGAPVGKASLTTESNSTWASQNVSSTPISISSGDTLTCTLTRADSVITYTVTQTATKGGATSSATFTYNLTGSPLLPNTAYWSIWPMGGAYTVLSLSVFTATPHHATLMAVGDSKTQGYFQTYFADRWVNRINAASPNYQTVVANGGGGDFTDNVIARLHEIKWLHPARVLLFIGSNDERNGRTLLQWETNYDYIADQLTKAGITVYHLLQTNETTLNFTAYNNHILQTFPASRIVNAGVISLYSDGIHPDSAGARQIADSVISQIGSQLAPIAPIIPAIRMQDLITSADTGANKTWPVNRILKATSLGYPRQVPFGTNQQNFPLTGPQVSGGGLSQSGNFTFDSLTNILHIGNPAVGPNLTDLAGNGALITAGFNPNASLQYIPTSTSASAIYMSAGSIYWYQNTGLTVGTAFTIRNTFQAVPGTSGGTFTFNPSNTTPNFNTLISNGDTHVNGTLFVSPIAATANGTITLNSNPATTAWNLLAAESTSQFIVEDVSHGTSPFAIASSAPTSSVNIFTSGNTGFNTSTDVASSLVTMVSTAKGFLPPRMTTAQFTAISSPATSLHAVLTDSSGRLALWNGSKVVTYATTDMLGSGSVNIYNTNGTLTGNRTLTLGGNTLAFSGLVGPPSTFAAIVHSTASDSGTYQVPLAYGTYIPTLTNTTNITSSIVNQEATYTRIGNIVHVNIACLVTPTTASTASVLTFTLPLTTSNGSQINIGSAALDINSAGVATYTSGIVTLASTTTGTLSFICTSLAGTSNVNIQFDYSL